MEEKATENEAGKKEVKGNRKGEKKILRDKTDRKEERKETEEKRRRKRGKEERKERKRRGMWE